MCWICWNGEETLLCEIYVECFKMERNLNVYKSYVENVENGRRLCYVKIYVKCLRTKRNLGMNKLGVKCVSKETKYVHMYESLQKWQSINQNMLWCIGATGAHQGDDEAGPSSARRYSFLLSQSRKWLGIISWYRYNW